MPKKLLYLFIFLLINSICQNVQSQYIDSLSFSIVSRQSFYSYEKNGEFLLHIPYALRKIIYQSVSRSEKQLSYRGMEYPERLS